jgi:hypothetical protein
LEVDEARKVADEAKAASTKNASDISALQGQLGTTDSNVSGILTRLGALETEVGVEEKSRIDVLEGVLNGAGDTEGLVAIVTGHGTKIGLLEAADTRIEKKADDNATAISALQDKVDTGDKSVKTYVDDAIAAIPAYDDTAVKKLITDEAARADAAEKANKAAIEVIYKAGEGEAAATGLLADEIARAKAAEKANADAIALLTNGAGTDEIDSVKELIDYVNAHGATVTGINNRLDGHDGILAGFGGEGQPATVKAYVDGAIAAIPEYVLPQATAETLGGVKSAKDVVNGETTTVAVNKVYVGEDGVGEVKAFSTDNLVQGSMTLVLNGGDAGVASN